MRFSRCNWPGLILVAAVAVFLGCPASNESPPGPVPAPGVTVSQPSPASVPAAPRQTEPAQPEKPPAPKPVIPKVVMDAKAQASCLVKVGDACPAAELPGLDGKPVALASLFGPKCTVLLLWAAGDSTYSRISALNALEDLQKDVLAPHQAKGVAVVAVNVQEPVDTVRKLVDDAKAAFPNLLDTDGSFFAKLATEKLPRIYLLDAQGKVLWLDIEYSQATRENLAQALQAVLQEAPGSERP